jgi:propanol-preferring alcohol dehydrogenase
MKAMVLRRVCEPLTPEDRPVPNPEPGQVLVQVCACAVCRTDLHVVDGELPDTRPPIVPGHEIIGRVVRRGAAVDRFDEGDRVGIAWLGWTCGVCAYCRGGRENLCAQARFTGYQIDGGFAEYGFGDAEAAPLMCAGLIGHRTLRMAGDARRIGIYGFGAAAHIAVQVARWEGREVFGFTRPGDITAQRFARRLGAAWAGGSDETPPEPLDAALIFAPVGALVPAALRATAPGGVVVCGGIHMSDIPAFPYSVLWMERSIRSVANLTRRDGEEFLAIAAQVPIVTETTSFALADANVALERLRTGALSGAAVLIPAGESEKPQ